MKLKVGLEKSIIIFDEAHNVEDTAEDGKIKYL